MGEEMNKTAVETVEAATTEEQAGTPDTAKEEAPEKKYTDADLDRIIARKIAAERKRMSKMFNDEQQNELEERERNVLRRELKADAKDALIQEGLPASLADILKYDSKEEYESSLKTVSAAFRNAVSQGVKDTLRGQIPQRGNPCKSPDIIRDAFSPNAR